MIQHLLELYFGLVFLKFKQNATVDGQVILLIGRSDHLSSFEEEKPENSTWHQRVSFILKQTHGHTRHVCM